MMHHREGRGNGSGSGERKIIQGRGADSGQGFKARVIGIKFTKLALLQN